MRFGPIAAAVLLLSLAPTLWGCGEEGTATAGGGQATTSAEKRPPGARRCGRLLGDFLDSLESMANTLAVGLTYEQYLETVRRVRGSYAEIDAERLGLVCLGWVAGPAERALNVYIDAANRWGGCLADASCDARAVEPTLQREWRTAADLLAEAQSGLRSAAARR